MDFITPQLDTINKYKSNIYFVEFQDLFEYLYLAYKIIEQLQKRILNIKQTHNRKISSCYIFAAAVSDFYIPLKEMVW